jgi:hypothetical protein
MCINIMLTMRHIFCFSVEHAHAISCYYEEGPMSFVLFKITESNLLARYNSNASSVPSTFRVNFTLVIILVTVGVPFHKTSLRVEVTVLGWIGKNDSTLFLISYFESRIFKHA